MGRLLAMLVPLSMFLLPIAIIAWIIQAERNRPTKTIKIACIVILCVFAVASLLKASTSHSHVWGEATCNAPRICSECGDTTGTPLGHDIPGLSCTKDAVCTRCGVTVAALGHDLSDATCTAPAKCNVCGETMGDALGHTTPSGVCGRCGTETNETIKVADRMIRDTAEYADVTALPCNQIFGIHNDVNPEIFGLPVRGYGTLLKYRPYPDTVEDVGYVVYEYTVQRVDMEFEKYVAFTTGGTTKDTIVWKKYSTAPAACGIQMLGLKELSIVFLGDSIVSGVGSSDFNGGENGKSGHLIQNNVKTWYRNTGEKCWVNQMIDYLTEYYPGVTACNNGIGGYNLQNVYDNLETLTLDDNGNRADVVILSIGTNARRYEDKYSGITVMMKKIINWLRVNNIQPIILTNTPLIETDEANNAENEKNLRGVCSAIMQACDETGTPCYDVLSEFYYYLWEHDIELSTDTLMADALHPNDAGYEVMFELIKRLLHV